jgi:glycosyltransferase involved in cell wall biosynthesis
LVHGVNITIESPMLMAEAFARQKNIPLISTPFVHVGPQHILRNYVMPHQLGVLKHSAVVFVQTQRELKALTDLGVKSHMAWLGMGVDPVETSNISPLAFRERHGLKLDEPLVLFMGTLSYDKGVVHALRAMQRLWQQGIPAKLVLAGDKPDEQLNKALRQISEAEQACVIQVGLVSGLAKQEMLAASTLLVLPSQIDSFGIVFLEAWQHGKPVIGAAAGGIPDVVDNNQDGFVVPFGDVTALADRIQQLIQQPDLAQQFGEQGRQKVHQHFTWDQVYQRWLTGVNQSH